MMGSRGKRSIALEGFFEGPNKTALRNDEVLVDIQVPPMPPRASSVYLKHSLRRAMDIAIVGVAVSISLAADLRTCQDIRILLGAVAPIPLRARKAEKILRKNEMSEGSILKAGELASEEAAPIDDIRSSQWYRREMVRELTILAIQRVFDQATSSAPRVVGTT